MKEEAKKILATSSEEELTDKELKSVAGGIGIGLNGESAAKPEIISKVNPAEDKKTDESGIVYADSKAII
ncbi:MAG: bacteriocin [Synergistaceae bacterium]|nr:bacteriocin [Synergistaceae bacterium]